MVIYYYRNGQSATKPFFFKWREEGSTTKYPSSLGNGGYLIRDNDIV